MNLCCFSPHLPFRSRGSPRYPARLAQRPCRGCLGSARAGGAVRSGALPPEPRPRDPVVPEQGVREDGKEMRQRMEQSVS